MAFQPRTRSMHALIDREIGEEQVYAWIAEGRTQTWVADQINTRLNLEGEGSCTQYYISRYVNRTDERREKWRAAKLLAGHSHADRLNTIAEEVLDGKRDPASVRAASENLRWLAAKRNHEYAERIKQDVNVTDITALHLEALRQRMQTVTQTQALLPQVTDAQQNQGEA